MVEIKSKRPFYNKIMHNKNKMFDEPVMFWPGQLLYLKSIENIWMLITAKIVRIKG